MKLIKVILVFFLIYLVKRFFNLLKVVRELKEEKMRMENKVKTHQEMKSEIIEADFKVLDR
jgi:uncharacterized protein YabN with tetrapyrrole methylase and pyrophosphatase domain